ncbi:MAG: heme lyase CcmF/NrfE family subunit [Alphaproteobacteria bacterium]|nr:heme lyase CcmF/NrfE family subunit [Alphaproteobacteria bacterium]
MTVSAFLVSAAFFSLMFAFVASDLSTLNVALNSHEAAELIYKISGTWGNHEGSMLLWLMLMTAGSSIFCLQRVIPSSIRFSLISLMGSISFCFHMFILTTSNPFVQLHQEPRQGMGLNPLLEDPTLAIHPPILYTGLTLLSVLFAFTIVSLRHHLLDTTYAKIMRPWSLLCWCFLTTGITLGSWWAYYELGWGGWWFWDPVENLSLLPWLIVTALIHSLTSFEKNQTQHTMVAWLGMGGFLMALLTLFLVRSGFLSSVHAFAVDPVRGGFLGIIFFTYLLYAIYTSMRYRIVLEKNPIPILSKEALIFLNTILLLSIFGIVLLGTLYPLILNQMSGILISVGAPYFNETTLPFFLIMLGLMTAVPYLKIPSGLKQSYAYVLTFFLGATITMAYFKTAWPLIGLLLFAISATLLISSFFDLWIKFRHKRLSLRYASMTLAHAGVAVLVLGAAIDTFEKQEHTLAFSEGQSQSVGPFTLKLERLSQVQAPYFQKEIAHLHIRKNNREWQAYPEKRYYPLHEMITSETAIQPIDLGDLYMILGGKNSQNEWLVKLQWHPAIYILWLGALMMIIAGLLGIYPALKRRPS